LAKAIWLFIFMSFTSLKLTLKKFLAQGWRFVSYQIFNWIFDNPLYLFVFHSCGIILGWIIMATSSLVSCAFLFWYYEHKKIDWLFAKAVKDWENKDAHSWGEKILLHFTKHKTGKYKFLIFILANINIDPLIVAVHYRENHFGGITPRDWKILVSSVAVSNLWWGARIGVLVTVLKIFF
jgi:hypothetical protein